MGETCWQTSYSLLYFTSMPSNTHSTFIEVNYRGFYICRVWHPGYHTLHFKIRMLDGSYSCICLASVKAAQNVIDTHINNIKKQVEPWS